MRLVSFVCSLNIALFNSVNSLVTGTRANIWERERAKFSTIIAKLCSKESFTVWWLVSFCWLRLEWERVMRICIHNGTQNQVNSRSNRAKKPHFVQNPNKLHIFFWADVCDAPLPLLDLAFTGNWKKQMTSPPWLRKLSEWRGGGRTEKAFGWHICENNVESGEEWAREGWWIETNLWRLISSSVSRLNNLPADPPNPRTKLA